MRVYIVSEGEKYEGSHIVGVYSSEEMALTKAKLLVHSLLARWGDATYDVEAEFNAPDNYWSVGCDFVVVRSYPVDNET